MPSVIGSYLFYAKVQLAQYRVIGAGFLLVEELPFRVWESVVLIYKLIECVLFTVQRHSSIRR